MTQLKLGVIGIGALGSRVALRLLWSGHHTLEIYDVADVATRLFTNDYGGMAIGSPKMMAQTCDAVITVLPSAAELREVCFGWEGLAEGFADGGIVIDLGTTDPVATVEIAGNWPRAASISSPPPPSAPGAGQGRQADSGGGRRRRRGRALSAGARSAGHQGAPRRRRRCRPSGRRDRRFLALRPIARRQRGDPPRSALRVRAGRRVLVGRSARRRRRRNAAPRSRHPQLQEGVGLGIVRRNLELAVRLAAATDTRSPLLEATREAWSAAEDALGYGADHTSVIKWLEALPDLAPVAASEDGRKLEPIESPPTG
jgi:3-hydroxyisobutyrate dehydrogenase-like beta-hydroxyacid dehydrogenase